MLCYNMAHDMVRGPNECFQLAGDLHSLSPMENQVNKNGITNSSACVTSHVCHHLSLAPSVVTELK